MTEEKELELLRNEVAGWRKVAKEIIDAFDPLHPGSDHVLLKYVCMGVKQANASLRETKENARRASQLLIEHVGSDGPMNVDKVAERAVEYIENLEAELAFIKAEYADADPETLTRDALVLQVNALKREREESEHQMHMRIRTGYDTTVADCWKAHCAKIEAQRDEALKAISLILQTDALKSFAFERGDDDASIYAVCTHLMKK